MGPVSKVGAEADGGNAQGQGDVAVGGAGLAGHLPADGGLQSGLRLLKQGFSLLLRLRAQVLAGSLPHQFHRQFRPVQNPVELFFHVIQPRLVVGAELAEHPRLLGDGVDGSSAGDGSHIEGGLPLGGHLDPVDLLDDSRQLLDGVLPAEIPVGVASLGLCGHQEAGGAHRPVGDGVQLAVKAVECLDPIPVILADLPAALQVAQALLPGIAHEEDAGARGLQAGLGHVLGDHQDVHQVGSVIPHAGTAELSSLLLPWQGIRVRKYHVRVGHEHHHRAVLLHAHRVDHV